MRIYRRLRSRLKIWMLRFPTFHSGFLEPLPPVGTLGFRIPLYGFKKWRELFTNRQLLSLSSSLGIPEAQLH